MENKRDICEEQLPHRPSLANVSQTRCTREFLTKRDDNVAPSKMSRTYHHITQHNKALDRSRQSATRLVWSVLHKIAPIFRSHPHHYYVDR